MVRSDGSCPKDRKKKTEYNRKEKSFRVGKLDIVPLSEVKPDVSIAGDSDYRRGVVHGLEIAWRLMMTCKVFGRFRKDLADASDVAMEFRYDRKSHPTLTEDIVARLAHTKGKTVMDRRRELLKLVKRELRQGQHCIGCAKWYLQGKDVQPGLRKQAAIEVVKATRQLCDAALVLLDEHSEFGQ